MTTLFTSIEQDLKSFLESLSPEDIQEMIDDAIYTKGKQYYEWELVENAQYSFDKSRLTATVAGSMDYTVRLALQEESIFANCSCPVEGFCKHITAVLLFALDKSNVIAVGENREEGSTVHQHLLGLSKDELVTMLLKHAPEGLLLEIRNRHASGPEALNIFNKAEAAIHHLFTNTELLYSPNDFSEALEKQVSRLLGLEHQIQDQLSELIFVTISEIENAFDRGYLYDDEYDTAFELPEAFNRLVSQFTSVLPYAEKNSFLKRLDEVLNETSYITFEGLSGLSQTGFREEELPALKELLLNDYEKLSVTLAEDYYSLVHHLLTEQEKEAMLLHLKDEDSVWLLQLAELYRKQGREKDAIALISKCLSTDPDVFGEEQLYLLYLDLLHARGQDLESVCLEAINCCGSSNIMEKIAAVSSKDIAEYERMLEAQNPQGLLEYLEKTGRLAEAHNLLKRNDAIWDHYRYVFYKNHKRDFPEEAILYFSEMIDKNLQFTGNSHYHFIAKALKQIRQIDEQQAAAMVAEIRANHTRRHNLMNLLSEV